MAQENVEVVRSLHEAFDEVGLGAVRDALTATSDVGVAAAELEEFGELVLNRVDPDIELYIGASSFSLPDMPTGTRLHGLPGWAAFWKAWLEAWDSFKVDYGNFAVGAEDVVLDKSIEAVGRGSGVEIDIRHSEVWTVRKGKIVRVMIFDTRAEALEAAGMTRA
jgi:hypothetical protein